MRHLESVEQVTVMTWASYYPSLRWLMHIPNGGARTKREGARLKKEGVKAGVSDLFLPMPIKPYAGLWIELKKRKKDGKSVLSGNQALFQEAMMKQGYKCVTCYGANEAIQVIKEYAKI